MTSSRKYLAAAVAAVVVLAGISFASASQLNVSGGSLFLQNASPCTNATIATTGFASGGGTNWNRVRLVGVPETCAGLPIQLTVYHTSSRGTTTQLAWSTGSPTAALGTVDVTVNQSYTSGNVTGVALLIGGWGVPTTWTPGGTVISLSSFQSGLYVTAAGTAWNPSPLIANSATNGANQQFDLTINADGSVTLQAANGRYVTAADAASPLIASSTALGTPQKFNLITNADGTIGLQSLANNMYVCADLNIATPAPLYANRTWILQWEEFYLVID